MFSNIFLCIPIFFLVIRPGIYLIGLGLDFIFNTIGLVLNKTININLQGTDLFGVFVDNFKPMIKLGFVNVIILFIIIPLLCVWFHHKTKIN